MNHLAERLVHLGPAARRWLLALAAVVAVAVGVADRLTGPDLSLLVFYLVPVVIVAWVASPGVAVAVALVISVEGILIAVATPDGDPEPVQIWNAAIRTVFYLVVVGLVSGQRRLLGELEARASTDPLTGTLNRAALYRAMERLLGSSRAGDLPLTVIYFDLDGLKRVNDETGHEAGDAMIARAAAAASSVLRREDLLARVGGDEFIAVLAGTDGEEARAVVPRLAEELARPVPGGPVRASFGVWSARAPADDVEGLVRAADELMYRAKRSRGEHSCYGGPDAAEAPSGA